MSPEDIQIAYEFGPFRLEPAKRRLMRDGAVLPLTPKAFDMLLLLIQNRERVVEKEEVLRQVWPDTVVEESNLAQNVFTLRKVLGDSPEGSKFIATIPRRGYRFVADVAQVRDGRGEGQDIPEGAPTPLAAATPVTSLGRRWRPALIGLALTALPVAAYLAGRATVVTPEPPQPKLTRLTFRRGVVTGARFGPDGRSGIYSAAWDGHPSQLFLSRPETPESMKLSLPEAELLSVSRQGELALALRPPLLQGAMGNFRTLARVPLTGGTPREVLDLVEAADWGPDGELAVVRKIENTRKRLEFPIGKVLVETTASMCLDRPRVSRDGKWVAYIDCPKPEPGGITTVDREGRPRRLYRGTKFVSGLGWSPRGDEIWFSLDSAGQLPEIRAVDLEGHARLIASLPGEIQDVSPEGSVLGTMGRRRSGIIGLEPGGTEERELSWLEGSAATDLSHDGRLVLFGEMLEGGGVSGRIYIRRTDGSPAVPLGEGVPTGLSADGRWVLARLRGYDGLTLIPTGAGETRRITGDVSVYFTRWFSDGRRVLAGGMKRGREGRLYVLDLETGAMRPITPEATGIGVVSPDGRWVASIGNDGHFLYPVDGGERRPLPGVEPSEWPVQWSADGRWLYVRREGEMPLRIFKVEVETGRRELWRSLLPADPAGVVWLGPLITPDGRGYVYTYHRILSDLYLVEGLK